jgi:hypothetical protein
VLPAVHVVVLHGQGHVADVIAPQVVAEQVLGFLQPTRQGAPGA